MPGSSLVKARIPECSGADSWPPQYMPTLAGWRAVAILVVLFHHAVLPLLGHVTALQYAERAIGADIFFALSGFVICSRLVQDQALHGRVRLTGFYVRRAFRILPLYWVFLAVASLLSLAGVERISSADWWSCLLFYRNYLPSSEWSWTTGHFWSLSVEEHFYLIFPVTLALLGIPRTRRWLPVALMLAVAWRMTDWRWHLFDHVVPGVPFPFRSDVRLDGIGYGCWAALLLTVPRWRAQLSRVASWLFPILIVLFTGFTVASVPMAMLWQRLLLPAMIVCTVLAPAGLPARLLESAPFRFIGRLSYGLFVWQQIFFPPGQARFWWQAYPLNLIGLASLAFLSHRYIERPMIGLGKRASLRLASHWVAVTARISQAARRIHLGQGRPMGQTLTGALPLAQGDAWMP